jgi:hypothetical protein
MHVGNGEAEPMHIDSDWAAHQDASGETADDQSKTPHFTIQNAGVISRSWGD